MIARALREVEIVSPAEIRRKIEEARLAGLPGRLARAWLIVGINDGNVPRAMVPSEFHPPTRYARSAPQRSLQGA